MVSIQRRAATTWLIVLDIPQRFHAPWLAWDPSAPASDSAPSGSVLEVWLVRAHSSAEELRARAVHAHASAQPAANEQPTEPEATLRAAPELREATLLQVITLSNPMDGSPTYDMIRRSSSVRIERVTPHGRESAHHERLLTTSACSPRAPTTRA